MIALVGTGSCGSHEEYRAQVGVVTGYDEAIELIHDLLKQSDKGEDDDD